MIQLDGVGNNAVLELAQKALADDVEDFVKQDSGRPRVHKLRIRVLGPAGGQQWRVYYDLLKRLEPLYL